MGVLLPCISEEAPTKEEAEAAEARGSPDLAHSSCKRGRQGWLCSAG